MGLLPWTCFLSVVVWGSTTQQGAGTAPSSFSQPYHPVSAATGLGDQNG